MDPDYEKMIEEIYAGDRYQRTLPQVEERLPRSSERPPSREPGGFDLGGLLFWFFVVVGGAAILMILVRVLTIYWGRSSRSIQKSTVTDDLVFEVGFSLDDCRARAAAGDFVGAVHDLLLLAIAELSARTEFVWAPGMTSREIQWELEDRSYHDQFGSLVDRVEWIYFGENAATLGDFQNQLRDYESLVEACQQIPATQTT